MDQIKPYTYLLINILTILGPLALSFDRKVAYHKYWLRILPGMSFTALFFIVWDMIFTKIGVWHFNSTYLSGINLYNLPLEEVLFFFTIPFSCLFLYIIFRTRWPESEFSNRPTSFFLILTLLFVVIAYIGYPGKYTFITAIFCAAISFIYWIVFKSRYLKVFLITYMVHLIPFLTVNGILTALPVVLYNDAENCGFRIYTIPVEDTMYSYLLLMMNIIIFEWICLSNDRKRDSIQP